MVDLSLRYGIITPYTSFLIEEPELSLTSEGRNLAGEAMHDEMSAMPTAVSGAQAVEDAKLRQDLGAAEAPMAGGGYAPEAPAGQTPGEMLTVRHVDDKAFICTPERCTDTTFIPDAMTAEAVDFGTERYRQLLTEHPGWVRYFALAPETIVVDTEGNAYEFIMGEPGDIPVTSTPLPATPASPMMTPVTSPETPTPSGPDACNTGRISHSGTGEAPGAVRQHARAVSGGASAGGAGVGNRDQEAIRISRTFR